MQLATGRVTVYGKPPPTNVIVQLLDYDKFSKPDGLAQVCSASRLSHHHQNKEPMGLGLGLGQKDLQLQLVGPDFLGCIASIGQGIVPSVRYTIQWTLSLAKSLRTGWLSP